MTLAATDKKNITKMRITRSLISSMGTKMYEAFEDQGVIEIMVNPDMTVWVDAFGKDMECIGTINPSCTVNIINTVATFHNKICNAENPILQAEFPIDGHRFQGMVPPCVDNPTFALRKKATNIFTLEDYVVQGGITEQQKAVIEQSILERKNTLIVGATSSGKTTFANAVIDSIARLTPDHRLNIIEDTKEIQSSNKNTVQMHSSLELPMMHLLHSCLRLRPDRILVGEVRGAEALQLLKAWNTGHPGGLATIHADSAELALRRMEQMIMEGANNPMSDVIAEGIDYIYFMEKCDDGVRRLTQMIEVQKYDRIKDEYVTRPID